MNDVAGPNSACDGGASTRCTGSSWSTKAAGNHADMDQRRLLRSGVAAGDIGRLARSEKRKAALNGLGLRKAGSEDD